MPPRHTPCENCRKQHVKCENGGGRCTRCVKLGKECVRIEEKWKFCHTAILEPSTIDGSSRRPTNHPYSPDYYNGHSGTGSEASHTSPQTLDQGGGASNSIILSHVLETTYFPWPKICPRDACLLRYFVQDLARWFDLCDPHRNFANEVPRRARGSQVLRNALVAASARHFSTLPTYQQTKIIEDYGLKEQLETINEEIVLDYHNRCITDLRSLAHKSDALMDEEILAAVVIMQFYEELDTPFIELPTETAARGLHVFIKAQASFALSAPGMLRESALWVGFRQEFHMAFSQQRPFRLPLAVYQSYLSWDSAVDHIWVNRLFIIGAHIVQFCYDTESDRSLKRYHELVQLVNRWLRSRPLSFSPIYFSEANKENGELFPRIWCLEECHVHAYLTVCLLRILLITFSPHTPQVGHARRESMNRTDTKLRETVFEICGIALSNRQSPPALLTACMAINICCDRFTDLREQQALMEIVAITSQDTNYSSIVTYQASLKKSWGWDV